MDNTLIDGIQSDVKDFRNASSGMKRLFKINGASALYSETDNSEPGNSSRDNSSAEETVTVR